MDYTDHGNIAKTLGSIAAALAAMAVVSANDTTTPPFAASTASAAETTPTVAPKPETTPTVTPHPPAPIVDGPTTNINPRFVDVRIANYNTYRDKPTDVQLTPPNPHLTWNATTGAIVGIGAPNTTYTATITYGTHTLAPIQFTTAKAPHTSTTYAVDGTQTYGIGLPIRIHFNHAITNKQDIEQRATVTTTPTQPGSWGWLNHNTLVWRPDTYWQPGTRINVNLPLASTLLTPTTFGTNTTQNLTIGRSLIMKIDNNTHHMNIIHNGQHTKTIPVSLGKNTPTHRTRSGTKIIYTQQRHHTMRGPEHDPYEVHTEYAMRLTNSGEFIHAAPWSVHAQGKRNVSHGCTNVSTDNAKWLYHNTLIGDVVETTNTGRHETNINNGWGSLWDLTPTQWRTKSALHQPHTK